MTPFLHSFRSITKAENLIIEANLNHKKEYGKLKSVTFIYLNE